MSNIKDYIDWRGDITLKQSYFNEVDNLIFSELIYINLKNIVDKRKVSINTAINTLLEKNSEENIKKELLLSQDPLPFLKVMKDSNRFSNLKLFNYVNILSKEEEKQFSAVCIELNYNTIYVAFKGTDNTILGWKEDFNLSFMSEIPSQLEAVKYLNKISWKYRNIIVGGHSKGGNLAVYAAVNCKKSIQRRIKKIFNNDGPGFLEEFISTKGYDNILNKVVTIVPESSIIGMLLTRKEEYKVVKSDTNGIWQHDALSWQVLGNQFVTLKEVDETSAKINTIINEWLVRIGKKERELFINNFFQILETNGIETVEDLSKLNLRKIPNLVKTFTNLEEESKKLMIDLLIDLVHEAKKIFDTKTILRGIKSIGINKRG